MLDYSIADNLMESMDVLQAVLERLEISVTVVSVLVLVSRVASVFTGPRNGLFATVNVFIFVVFLGCCGFLVVDGHHAKAAVDAVLERLPTFSN